MNMDVWVKVFQIISYLAAAVGFVIAVYGYRNSNKIKRGEWLKDLFDKFYKEKDFAEVRREIDTTEIEKFLHVDKEGKIINEQREEAFVNFLNFFEFIAVLEKRNYLHEDEIKDLFNYYLKSIAQNKFVRNYIKQYDFENLENLLKSYE